jgi:probable phosphoglycerate mutase
LGQRQAAALAEHLRTHLGTPDAIYASTMRRAKETAEAVATALNCPIQWEDRLREVGNNRLDHSPWPNDDLPRNYVDFQGSERPFSAVVKDVEMGESWMHFRMRVGLFLEEMADRHHRQYASASDAADASEPVQDDTVVAVCHGGVVEAALSHVFNIGHSQHNEVWTHNTAITRLQYLSGSTRDKWVLHYHNRVIHLQGVEQEIFV